MTAWSVYLIRTPDGALYTGISTDVNRRLAQHTNGRGAKYLRGRGPLELVYRLELGDRGFVQRIEARLKSLPKAEKEALVAGRPSRRRLLKALQ